MRFEEDRERPSGGGAARFPVWRHHERWAAQWAYEDRLVDLADVLGPVLDLFDADTIDASTLLDGKTGRRGLYALPMGRIPTTSMPGTASWSGPDSPSPTFPLSGRPSGPSGATRCSRPCARPSAATTSGLLASPCPRLTTPTTSSFQFQLAYGTPWFDLDRRLRSTTRDAGGDHQGAATPTPTSGARAARRPTRRAGPTSTTTRHSSPRPSL